MWRGAALCALRHTSLHAPHPLESLGLSWSVPFVFYYRNSCYTPSHTSAVAYAVARRLLHTLKLVVTVDVWVGGQPTAKAPRSSMSMAHTFHLFRLSRL